MLHLLRDGHETKVSQEKAHTGLHVGRSLTRFLKRKAQFEQVKDWIIVMSSEKVIVCFTIMSVLKENINLTAKLSIRYCEAVKATYNYSSGLV